MPGIKLRWTIDYWNDDLKKVEHFRSEERTWEEAPKKNVIYAHITATGVSRRYGNPASTYTYSLLGTDFYYFYKKNGVFIFGGWNDERVGPTTTNGPSKRFVWHPDGRCEFKMFKARPDRIPDEAVKEGVWVEEPWASELGLSEKVASKNIVSGAGGTCPTCSI